jgi:hypothetical protein
MTAAHSIPTRNPATVPTTQLKLIQIPSLTS